MSMKSQQTNMIRLADLLSHDFEAYWNPGNPQPNALKKTFLNLGKVFLRALAKDLGLRDVQVISNNGGIFVTGECSLYGMWQTSGLFLHITQPIRGEDVILYRTIRNVHDYKGGYDHHVSLDELRTISYEELLERLSAMHKDQTLAAAA